MARCGWPARPGAAADRSDHASACSSERAAQRPLWLPALRAADSDYTRKNNLKFSENLFLFNVVERTVSPIFPLALVTGLIIKLTGENGQL